MRKKCTGSEDRVQKLVIESTVKIHGRGVHNTGCQKNLKTKRKSPIQGHHIIFKVIQHLKYEFRSNIY